MPSLHPILQSPADLVDSVAALPAALGRPPAGADGAGPDRAPRPCAAPPLVASGRAPRSPAPASWAPRRWRWRCCTRAGDLRPGEEGLRPARILALLEGPLPFEYFDPDLLRATPGWPEAFAVGHPRPRGGRARARPAPGRDRPTGATSPCLWRSVSTRRPGTSATAARSTCAPPSCSRAASRLPTGPLLATITGRETAALARFLRALPDATLAAPRRPPASRAPPRPRRGALRPGGARGARGRRSRRRRDRARPARPPPLRVAGAARRGGPPAQPRPGRHGGALGARGRRGGAGGGRRLGRPRGAGAEDAARARGGPRPVAGRARPARRRSRLARLPLEGRPAPRPRRRRRPARLARPAAPAPSRSSARSPPSSPPSGSPRSCRRCARRTATASTSRPRRRSPSPGRSAPWAATPASQRRRSSGRPRAAPRARRRSPPGRGGGRGARGVPRRGTTWRAPRRPPGARRAHRARAARRGGRAARRARPRPRRLRGAVAPRAGRRGAAPRPPRRGARGREARRRRRRAQRRGRARRWSRRRSARIRLPARPLRRAGRLRRPGRRRRGARLRTRSASSASRRARSPRRSARIRSSPTRCGSRPDPLLVPVAADRVLAQLHAFDGALRATGRSLALSFPRNDLERSEREPSSLLVEVGAALGRPDPLHGAAIPDLASLAPDRLRPRPRGGRPLSRASGRSARSPGRTARRARGEVPPAWTREAAVATWPASSRSAAARGSGPATGLLGARAARSRRSRASTRRTPSPPRRSSELLDCPLSFLLARVLRWSEPAGAPSLRELDPLSYGEPLPRGDGGFYERARRAFTARKRTLAHWLGAARGRSPTRELDELLLETRPLVGRGVVEKERQPAPPRPRALPRLRLGPPARPLRRRGAAVRLRRAARARRGRHPALRPRLHRPDRRRAGPRPPARPQDRAGAPRARATEEGPTPGRDVQLGLYGLVARRLAADLDLPKKLQAAYAYAQHGEERAFRGDYAELEAATKGWLAVAAGLLAEHAFPPTPRRRRLHLVPLPPGLRRGRPGARRPAGARPGRPAGALALRYPARGGGRHDARAPPRPGRSATRAIAARGVNVLVDAGAGTGKTTLLVERLVAMVAPPDDASTPLPLSEIAAITFTRKAAGELKLRVRERLLAELAAAPGAARRELLARALSDADTAFIGTIHGFADRLLRAPPGRGAAQPVLRDDRGRRRALRARPSSCCSRRRRPGGSPRSWRGPAAPPTQAAEAQEAPRGSPSRPSSGPRRARGSGTTGSGSTGSSPASSSTATCPPPSAKPARFERLQHGRRAGGVPRARGRLARRRSAARAGWPPRSRGSRRCSSRPIRPRSSASWPHLVARTPASSRCGATSRTTRPAGRPGRRGPTDKEGEPLRDQAHGAARTAGSPPGSSAPSRRRSRCTSRSRRATGPSTRSTSAPEAPGPAARPPAGPRRAAAALPPRLRGRVPGHRSAAGRDRPLPLRGGGARDGLDRRGARPRAAHRRRRPEAVDLPLPPRRHRRLRGGPRRSSAGAAPRRRRSPPTSAPSRRSSSTSTPATTSCSGRSRRGRRARSTPRAAPSPTCRSSPGARGARDEAVRRPAARDRERAGGRRARPRGAGARHLDPAGGRRRPGRRIVDPATRRGAAAGFGDVAVLAHSTSTSASSSTQLDRLGVPWSARGGTLFLEDPLHRQFLLALRAVADRDDGVAQAALLRAPFFAARPGRPRARARRGRRRWRRDAGIARPAPRGRWSRSCAGDRLARPPGETARDLLDRTGLARAVAFGPNGAQRLERLRELCLEVERIAAAEGLDYDGVTARLRAWALEPVALDPPRPVGGDAVQIMTIHQAKGLEFPIVAWWDGHAKLAPHDRQARLVRRADRRGLGAGARRARLGGAGRRRPAGARAGLPGGRAAAARLRRRRPARATCSSCRSPPARCASGDRGAASASAQAPRS